MNAYKIMVECHKPHRQWESLAGWEQGRIISEQTLWHEVAKLMDKGIKCRVRYREEGSKWKEYK